MNIFQLFRKIRRRLAFDFRARKWEKLRLRFPTLTVRTKQGTFTVSTADQAVGRDLFCGREYEMDLTLRVMSWLHERGALPPGTKGTLLDVGANLGSTSIGMIRCGWMGKAIAIEPDPTNFELLRQNVRQNQLQGRVTCLPFAASAKRGSVVFELSERNFGDHRVRVVHSTTRELYQESGRQQIEVIADTLDHLLETCEVSFSQDLALAWIDTQGHEGHVFEGGRRTFSRDMPVVVEVWPYGLSRAGTSVDAYCSLAAGFWGSYWVWRGGRFESRPISQLSRLFAELGDANPFENVVFMK